MYWLALLAFNIIIIAGSTEGFKHDHQWYWAATGVAGVIFGLYAIVRYFMDRRKNPLYLGSYMDNSTATFEVNDAN